MTEQELAQLDIPYVLYPGGVTRWVLTSDGYTDLLGGPYRFSLQGPTPLRGELAVRRVIPAPGLTWRVTFPADLPSSCGDGVTVHVNPTPLMQNGEWLVYPLEEFRP